MSPELQKSLDLQYEELVKQAEELFPDDKPARRQYINVTIDFMVRDYDYEMMRTDLSEEELDDLVREYNDYLCNLAAKDTHVEYHSFKTKLLSDEQYRKRISNSSRY